MNYSKWKTETPSDKLQNKCLFCGEPCDREYCNAGCKKADIDEKT